MKKILTINDLKKQIDYYYKHQKSNLYNAWLISFGYIIAHLHREIITKEEYEVLNKYNIKQLNKDDKGEITKDSETSGHFFVDEYLKDKKGVKVKC